MPPPTVMVQQSLVTLVRGLIRSWYHSVGRRRSSEYDTAQPSIRSPLDSTLSRNFRAVSILTTYLSHESASVARPTRVSELPNCSKLDNPPSQTKDSKLRRWLHLKHTYASCGLGTCVHELTAVARPPRVREQSEIRPKKFCALSKVHARNGGCYFRGRLTHGQPRH